ncbi:MULTISPECIES: WXG100 family type VII secretion target [Nocardia]|uniref:WXG100 family type VII secretion target n=1 Tax=Nocardia TaxID=1817 RepID=UPI0015EF7163|nr:MULTISPECIES: WXG100 family type VII secretion target [Nocardia]MCA2210226.1 WXG100 family type VII secretion target [Nocardia rosealba]
MAQFQDEVKAVAAANVMETSIASVRRTLQEITSSIEASRPGWVGDAQTQFDKVSTQWNQESADLNQKLDAIHEAVQSGTQGLSQMNQANAAEFTVLKV